MTFGVLFGIAVALGWLATALVRALCFRFGVLDVPNARSGHTAPTPTLGGVGLMLGAWAALVAGWAFGVAMPPFVWGLLGASALQAILIYDEVRPMGRVSKLLVQTGAALLVLGAGVVMDRVALPGGRAFDLGRLAFPVTLVGLVALQNLYNFMDGLDGFAGQEGVLAAGVLGLLLAPAAPDVLGLLLAVSGATLGFWVWNAPPARIFMGDVGAHFLGLCFGAVGIRGDALGVPFWVAMLPLGAFLFDAIYTLCRRLLRGENITLAHRFHLYQRLHQMGWSARRINGVYGLITLLLGATAVSLRAGGDFWGGGLGAVSGIAMVLGTVWVEVRWARRERGA